MLKSGEASAKVLDFGFSIGLRFKEDGTVDDVIPGLPAADAGVAPGMKLIAVNGRRWNTKLLHETVQATKTTPDMELILENADFIKAYTLKYNGGERYPHLERDTSKPDLLQEVIKPLTSTSKVRS